MWAYDPCSDFWAICIGFTNIGKDMVEMNIKLITVTNAPENAGMLIKSAEKQGWDLCVIQCEWKGFGTKLIETYNYLKSHPEVERFVFADAFDVVVLGTPEELEEKIGWWHDKIICSTEKGLWPPPLHAFRSKYMETESQFKYINSGVYAASREKFLSLMDDYPPNLDHDDQLWMNICYLLEPDRFVLDFNQVAFNSHSFIQEGEYTYENNRVQILESQPIFIHLNGKTVDEKFNEKINTPSATNPFYHFTPNDMNLTTLQSEWIDSPEYHSHIHELFTDLVNKDEVLCGHRDWVQNNIWGFGERSFHYLWKLLLEELPGSPNILEIGCFRGQTLSLFKLLRPDASVFGITPLDASGGMWESDYGEDIKRIHDVFEVELPVLMIGKSQDDSMVYEAMKQSPFDVVYIDGSHEYSDVVLDLKNYAPMVKIEGYLIVDDAASKHEMPFGFFTGIADVCKALYEWEMENSNYEFQFNLVHIMVYKRTS